MTPALEFHPEALDDARAAHDWYLRRSPEAARAFLAEIDRAASVIVENPDAWPPYLHGTRRYLLQRFPFSVVYRAGQTIVHVVAVAHARRRPGYWSAR
ncbi:MAG: type II toxin-antitoxin system RelE/ParE family toxin [Myxococcota bacterium]